MANDTSNSKLAPTLQKIEGLTKPQRLGIYVATLVAIIGLSGWLLFWPKYQEIKGLRSQLDVAMGQLEKARADAEKLNEWRTKMKKKEVKYKAVMQALPEKEEIPSLLTGISQAGKETGLDFLLFEPKGESQEGFYAEIPVDIKVSGSYHEVATFFDKVSNLPRIVNIRNVTMDPRVGKGKDANISGKLETSCQAVTYKFIEGKDQANTSTTAK